ncbi:MAG: penicillin acylase family protein [Anaerolineae bacterium]|nr:penicillin acylase family protein [Anaerolineae bacterium]
MRRRALGTALVILVSLLVLALVVVAVLGFVYVRSPFPQTDGRLELEGLQDVVHVYRDEYGVPQIYAMNEHDLYFAQGFVHAQDRFWQMEFWRHIGQGRISEITGEAGLESDRFIRTVGWNRMAEASTAYVAEEAPETMAILEAYSAGVNAYLAQQGDDVSINRRILGLVGEPWEIEPWEPLDTIGWGIVMARELSGNWEEELDRAAVARELGEATAASLHPAYPFEERPVIAPTELLHNRDELAPAGAQSQLLPEGVDWGRVDMTLVGEPPVLGLALGATAVGSNSWVVTGEHTESGLPILANDPHLGIQMPSIWYQMGLHGPGLNVSGFSFAGAPGIVIGHNEHIAWSMTNVGPDVQDLYIERINPSNPDQYEFQGSWEDMEIITERILVNGGEPVDLPVRITRHGPILNEVIDGESDVLAMRWTAMEPNAIFHSLSLLNRAQNYEEFREALRYFDVPAQNFVYADVEGNIAYQTPGRIPIRANGMGLVPVPGWTGEYEWEGYIPYEELPALFNPERGYIVTANNSVVDEAYPHFISYDWNDGDRAQRIEELLLAQIESGGPFSVADMTRIQMDAKSLLAESYIPLLAGLSSDEPRVQAALERLRGWDMQAKVDSVPAALFEIFTMQLADVVLADELGAARDRYFNNEASQRIFFHALAEQPDAAWWDDTTTTVTETQRQAIMQALDQTVAWFEDNVGNDVEKWTWGELHTATFVSDPLGQSGIAPMEALVNRGPYRVGGTTSAVNATRWSWSEPAAVTTLPSLRMVLNLSDFDSSLAIHTTGQSGHPFHPHYDDLIPMWQTGEYYPMVFTPSAITEATAEHLRLFPAEVSE